MTPAELKTMRGGAVIETRIDGLRSIAERFRQNKDAAVKAGIMADWGPQSVEDYAVLQSCADGLDALLQAGASKLAVTVADAMRSTAIMELTLRQPKPEAADADAT